MLRLNPKVLGTVIDETGSIPSGKLILSADAWTDFLGRSEEQLSDLSLDGLKYLERRMSGLRVSLAFGWAGGEGSKVAERLCVLGVRA